MRRKIISTTVVAGVGVALLVSAPQPASSRPGDAPTCFGKAATIVATPSKQQSYSVVDGTDRDDVIVVKGFEHVMVEGLDGDDRICGDRSTDWLKGGQGDDRLWGGDDRGVTDNLVGGPGRDYLTGKDPQNGGGGRDLLVKSDSQNGGPGDDVLRGQAYPCCLGSGMEGGSGDDVLTTLRGEQVVKGEGGNDRITGGPRDDLIYGGTGDDRLSGQGGDDTLDGGSGDDSCAGDSGTDEAVDCEEVQGVP